MMRNEGVNDKAVKLAQVVWASLEVIGHGE